MILRPLLPEDKEHIAANLSRFWRSAEEKLGKPIWDIITMEDTRHAFALTWPDGSPAAVVGVDEMPEDPPGVGFIWLVGGAEMDRRPVAFARRSRSLIPEVFERTPYDLLHTFVGITRTANLNFACRGHGLQITRTLPPHEKGLPMARFDLEVRRPFAGPRPMINLTVELGGDLPGRFPGVEGGTLELVLRKEATAGDALKALSLELDQAGTLRVNGAPVGRDDVLPARCRLTLEG